MLPPQCPCNFGRGNKPNYLRQSGALRVAVDLSLAGHMSTKEILKVTKQLRFLYGLNRRAKVQLGSSRG